MSSFCTNAAVTAMANGSLDLDTGTLKVMLLKNTYSESKTHGTISAISSVECTASGYTGGFGGAGRKTLAGVTVTKDDSLNRMTLTATNPAAWTALGTGNTLRYAAVVREITNDASSIVVCILDIGSDFVTNGGDFTLAFNASGVCAITT